MTVERKQLGHVTESGETVVLHFETSAAIVLMSDGTNVEERLENVSNIVTDNMAPLRKAVETLNGNEKTPGSVANSIQTAIAPVNASLEAQGKAHDADIARIDGDVNTVDSTYYKINEKLTPLQETLNELTGEGGEGGEGGGSIDDRIKNAVTPVKEAVDTLNGDKTTEGSVAKNLEDRISPIEQILQVLQGDENTDGSIAKQVADAIARVVANAPEDLNDLMELATWIHEHETDAAGMQASITQLQTDLTALTNLVNTMKAKQEEYAIQTL